ncbi:MAG: GNAT family N-acetyltransferase, partial [Clostridia bacterium]|nr:GNAT family N-acetyltransferase [Clostridia bacterium]
FEEFSASPKRSRFRAFIVRKTDVAVAGGVFVSPPHVLPDLAIMIYRPYREQGFGTAAFTLAVNYCFDVMGLSELYAGCYEGNVRSRKMLAACGFVPHPEGNCEEVHFRTGEPIMQYDYIKTK